MSGNKYEISINKTWDKFAEHLSGARDGLFCVLSEAELSEGVHNALLSTAKSLGYEQSVTFLTLKNPDSNKAFELVEGLDPLCIVASNAQSAKTLAAAYRTEANLNAVCRLFGRTCVLFENFESMLNTADSKQRAWALLKQLPKPNN